MTDFYVKGDGGSIGSGTYRGPWVGSSNFAVGDRVVCTRNYTKGNAWKYVYECTTDAGSSGGSEPTWGTTVDGTTTDSGITWTCREATSWANASYYLDYIVNMRAAAGDTVFVASNYSVTIGTSGNFNADMGNAGTETAPIKVLSVTEATPPTTLTAGAQLATSNFFGHMYFGAGFAYYYGLTFYSGNKLYVNYNDTTGGSSIFDTCTLRLNTGGSSADTLWVGSYDPYQTKTLLVDSVIQSDKTNWSIGGVSGVFEMYGGSFAGSAPSDGLFKYATENRYISRFRFVGVDMSLVSGALVNLVTKRGPFELLLENCKLNASVSLTTGTWAYRNGQVVRVYNSDSGDTNYNYARATYDGTILDETTLVRTGGASDGTTTFSWKETANADASYLFPLESDEIAVWNETVGSQQTATIEILHDSATNMTDDEIWMRLEYPGTSGYPVTSFVDDAKADVMASAADQADSSATWTTTGMSNPNTQKLSVTFTAQEKGWIRAKVFLADPSKTVYVDPKITLS